jgi:hypothetical protein
MPRRFVSLQEPPPAYSPVASTTKGEREDGIATKPTWPLYDELIEFLVGNKPVQCWAHQGILCQSSPAIKQLLSPLGDGRNLASIRLRKLCPDEFRFFIQWMYTKTLAHEDLESPNPAFFRLVRLYAVAELFETEALQNNIIDTIVRLCERYNSVPTPQDTQIMYLELRGGRQLRRLVVDLFVWKRTDHLVLTHKHPWSVYVRYLAGERPLIAVDLLGMKPS